MAGDPNPPPNPKSSSSQTNQHANTTRPSPHQSSASKPSSTPSLASRISSSATGLLHSTFSPRAASASSDFPATLAAGLSSKGSSSSGSNHAVSGGAMSLARESGSGSASSAPGGSFRSTRANGSGSASPSIMGMGIGGMGMGMGETAYGRGDSLLEMEYLQDLEFEALSRSGLQTPVDTGIDKGKGKALDPDEKQAFERAWLSTATTTTTTVPEVEVEDGAAVSSLLSDPSFQPMFSFDTELEEDTYDGSDEPNPFLAPPQTVTSASQNHEDKSKDVDISPISLIPGLSDLLSSLPPLPNTSSAAEEVPLTQGDISRLSTLLSQSHSSIQEELGADWLALDAVYHDAVWGNWIEPYVRAAKEEVDREAENEKKGDEGVEREGPAVRRLGAILGHLRARL